MLLLTIVAAMTLSSGQTGPSLYDRFVPNPTGHNGYEEYLRAADVLDQAGWNLYANWLLYRQLQTRPKTENESGFDEPPPVPPGVSPEMTDLEVRKIADQHVGGVFDIVRQGNDKQVYDPRVEMRYDTLLPEFAKFKSLSRVAANKAHVDFSDGRSKQGVDDLLAVVKFAWKLYGISRISSLVAVAQQSIALAEFQEHLGQLSLSDAKQIERSCTGLIEGPVGSANMYNNERSEMRSILQDLFVKSGEMLSSEDETAYGAALRKLGPADQQLVRDMVGKTLEQRTRDEERRVNGPESGWIMPGDSDDPKPIPGDYSPSNLALMVIEDVLPVSTQRTFLKGLAKGRIQLRLLRLHAKVIEFHWQHNRWPNKIEEFADAKTAFDPFEQAPFHYEMEKDGYRIYSLGIPGLGPIELKYKPLAAPSSGGVVNPTQ